MNRAIKVYISGPITGIDDYKSRFNNAEATLFFVDDVVPVNPIKTTPFNPNWTWRDYMSEDIKVLLECDAVYMLKGWRRSKGARLERHIAKKMGMDIYYE